MLVGDLWPEDLLESDLDEENDGGLGVPATSNQNAKGEKTAASEMSLLEQARTVQRMDWDAMKQLHEAMKASHDWLCFIWYQEDGTTLPKWYLVQVDLDGTDLVLASR